MEEQVNPQVLKDKISKIFGKALTSSLVPAKRRNQRKEKMSSYKYV
jgi:hypothetical protein